MIGRDMKKWLKITLILLSMLVGLLLLVSFLAPPVAKSYVNHHGKELIGRTIEVHKIRLNVLAGRVRIYDLKVYEEDDTIAFFTLDTLDVAVKLYKLLGHDLHVKHITLAEPNVRIVQEGSRFNFSSIIDHFATDEEEPDQDTTPSDWTLGFYNIRLSHGAVRYQDISRDGEWDLRNLNLKVPGVYFDGSQNTDAGLALQLADGGVLRTDASLNMDDNRFSVKLDLSRFAVSNARSYLTDFMKVGRTDGLLDAHINVKGTLDDILAMDIGGTLALSQVDIRDAQQEVVLQLGNLAMAVNRINIASNIFDIKSVTLDGLVSRFALYENGSNFSQLFASEEHSEAEEITEENEKQSENDEPDSTSAAASEQKPFVLKVGHLAVNGGKFTFSDHTLAMPFSFPVEDIKLNADNISTSGENQARFFARLPKGGMAMLNWKGKIADWKEYQKLSLTIKNLHLQDLSPYSLAFLGHPFTNGTFSFTSENTIRNSMLNGNNKLDLFNPEVGAKDKSVKPQVNVPLRAALYVLKDKDNKVEFEVPVKGNIDSPEFSYMKIVWKTLGNLLVKVATSPIRMVSQNLGHGDGLEYIAFNPQQIDFTSEQYDALGRLVEVAEYDSSIVIILEPQLDLRSAAQAQSLFNLKKDYYLAANPDKADAGHLELIDYSNIEAISLKDGGFLAYLMEQGYTDSRTVSERKVRQVAEERYPLEQSCEEVRQNVERRNFFLNKYFVDQMQVTATQLRILPLVEDAKDCGYVISSELKE